MKHILTASVLVILSYTGIAQHARLQGFTDQNSKKEIALEQQFDSALHNRDIQEYIKTLSARPHHVGSAGDKAVSDFIFNEFKKAGFDVARETYYVLFPTPKTRQLEMLSPVKYTAVLAEPALKEDPTSSQESEQLPSYNCWSADGDVTAELVFVNYGLPEDYDRLKRMGIDVKGKIVIAKYGRSWRGIKPKVAQENGAVGCIIYSDPKEDGYYQGDVYPKGAFKNEYGVQRGSVLDMPIYPGDPLTPDIAATKDAKRIDRQNATNLLKIPVLPISYHDAAPLLKSLEGPVAPEEWRGALPFTYHIGPGKTMVHLKLAFNWDIKPITDVIAKMKGDKWPDEWVVRGNHHDAWVNGAGDPISGQAAMLEEAKSIGNLAKSGWKPARTLVYCAWDGEEPGLLGSTEWVEDHIKELQQKATIYINSDGNERGFLGIEGSHALEPFLNEVAADITDPETHISVAKRKLNHDIITAGNNYKTKKDLLAKNKISIGALGSGSDYSPFIQHAGIPSVNLGYGGEAPGGEYHSIYDSYNDYKNFKDPDFLYGTTLAQTAGRIALRMANSEMLPFDFRSFASTLDGYLSEIVALADQEREKTSVENRLISEQYYATAADPREKMQPPPVKTEVPYLNFSELQNAVHEVDMATSTLADSLLNHAPMGGKQDEINQLLYKAEQQLLSENGLPRRPWYRHTIYAPGFYTGYGVKTLPGIREAIEQANWTEAQQQIVVAAAVLKKFAAYIGTISTSIK